MFYTLTTYLLIAIGIVIAAFTVRYLIRTTWFKGWLKGMLGFSLLFCSAVLALVGVDFYSYQQLVSEKSVATLEFSQLDEQKFSAKILTSEGKQYNFDINGDQWQLDARIIKWPSAFGAVGVRPAFRLERISGRYYSWEKEQTEPRSVFPLDEHNYSVDIWEWSKRLNLKDVGIDATYGSATYLPMADGALYEVSLSNTGLVARPFNKAAESAINRWN